MFYQLPEDLIRLIYEFDPTYHEVFDEVLKEVKRYYIYESIIQTDDSYFLVYDFRNKTSYLTDSLEVPSWISISYRVSKQDLQQMIMRKNLYYNRSASLQYDIAIYEFQQQQYELHVLEN